MPMRTLNMRNLNILILFSSLLMFSFFPLIIDFNVPTNFLSFKVIYLNKGEKYKNPKNIKRNKTKKMNNNNGRK